MIPCATPCHFAAVLLYQEDGGRSKIDALRGVSLSR